MQLLSTFLKKLKIKLRVIIAHMKKSIQQMNFFKTKDFPVEFGGELLKGRRKSRRPLSTKKPIHLVFRADIKGHQSLKKSRQWINTTIKIYSERFDIKVYQQGLEWNHFHLVVKTARRECFQNFLRALAGVIALKLKLSWAYRPFTRVLNWGRSFRTALRYTLQNELEGLGLIPYQPRGRSRGPPHS